MSVEIWKINRITIYALSLLFVFGFFSVVPADASQTSNDRDIAVDFAIGGMKEGSRILSPGTAGAKNAISKIPGSAISPAMDIKSASSLQGARGTAEISSGIQGSTVSGGAEHSVGTPSDTAGSPGIETGTTDTSNNPIVDVDANLDLGSGTVDADVGLDTSGSQLLEADISGAGADTTGALEADIGSIQDISGESLAVATGPEGDTLTAESSFSGAIDTTGDSIGGETDIGIEADISGTGPGEDIASDPADGLTTTI